MIRVPKGFTIEVNDDCGNVGGFMCPGNAEEAIKQKEKELGVKAPDDLGFGYMKD